MQEYETCIICNNAIGINVTHVILYFYINSFLMIMLNPSMQLKYSNARLCNINKMQIKFICNVNKNLYTHGILIILKETFIYNIILEYELSPLLSW